MTPPLTLIDKSDTVRLIPTANYKPPALRALVDTDEEADILAGIEGLTNRRLRAEKSGLLDLDPRELVFKAWGQTHINAAFAYPRAGGNRFNGGDRGAWYCAFDDATAIAEVGYHRSRELIRIDRFHDEAVYQSLLAGFIGDFHDVRGIDPMPAYLGPDVETAYPLGQAFAKELRAEGSRGIVYPSVRNEYGTCLVAFQPHLVQNVRPGARWRLVWDGSAVFEVVEE